MRRLHCPAPPGQQLVLHLETKEENTANHICFRKVSIYTGYVLLRIIFASEKCLYTGYVSCMLVEK